MNDKKIQNSNIYLPICKRCGEVLKIELNPLKFNIIYTCGNEGLTKHISYKEFDKKYMKDINSLNSELKNGNNSPNCIQDEKEKNYKNIVKYIEHNEVCQKHTYCISEYCINCNKNICLFCKTEDEHIQHKDNIKIFSEIIPSRNKIVSLNQEITKKEKFNQIIILEIEKWKNEMIKKVEQIKNLLNEEISLFKKMVFNYNRKYLNYNYINNFNVIYDYIRENNQLNRNINTNKDDINKNLFDFYHENNFYEKTSILITSILRILFNFEKKNLNPKSNLSIQLY